MQKNKNVKNAKEYVKKVNIYIKSYKVTFNFLYLTKTSWCRFIIFIEESLIPSFTHFALTFDLTNVYNYEKDLQFYWLLIPIHNISNI